MPAAVQLRSQSQRESESQVSSTTIQEAVQAVTVANNSVTVDTVCTLNKLNIVLSRTPGLLSLPTAARLPYCLHNWKVITSDQWVLQVVQGYSLELTSTPYQRGAPCPLSSQHQPAVEEEVQKLLTKGAIRKVEPCPGQFVSRLFLIAKKDGSFRPVVNLRPLNQFMARAHFKMEGINMLKDLHRSERCMPLGGSEDRIQEVPPFCLGRTDIRVPVPSIWIEQCTKGIHQAPEASSGSPQVSRNSPCDFLGQHASAGPDEGRSGGLDGPDSPVVQSFGVLSQPGKVTVDSGTADSISGVSHSLSEFEDPAHTGEDRATDRNLQGHQTAGEFNSARPSQAY